MINEELRPTETHSNWFRRHLNWTLILGWFGAAFIVALISVGLQDWFIPVVFGLFAVVAVNSWVLQEKGRSWLWVWLYLVGLGIVPLIIALVSRKKTTVSYVKEHGQS